ncbi:MAG TPA: hypothetical protein VH396_17340 [Chitinophagaceae bacterium]|jgi:hypothetical protein
MKKLLLITALIVTINFSFAQSLQKGNLVGLHVITTKLNAGATMDQFKEFFISKVLPVYEKEFKAKGYLVKAVRGDNNNSFGIIWIFDTEQDRDKYFNSDGTPNNAGKSAMEKVNVVEEELKKFGTYDTKYTDWVVQ